MTPLSHFILALTLVGIFVSLSASVELHADSNFTGIKLSYNRNRDHDHDHDDEVSKNFDCPSKSGRYPHPQSCEHYFECRSGRATLKRCSRGDLYDEQSRECRDKRRVKCHRDDNGKKTTRTKEDSTTMKQRITTTTQAPTTPKGISKNFDCPAIYGRYPHSQSCEYYFECRSGRATLKRCSRGDLYDEERRECREKRRVKCHREGNDGDESGEEKEFKCPSSYGTFPHPVDCSKFYVCRYNLPSLLQCPDSKLFNERDRSCQPKNRVKCGDRLDRDEMKTSRRPGTSTTKQVVTTTKNPTTAAGSTVRDVSTTIKISTTPELTTTMAPELTTTTTPEVSSTTSTLEPTTTSTPEPTTISTTEAAITETTKPPTTTMTPESTTVPDESTPASSEPTTTTIEITTLPDVPVTKPNTPPPTDCDEKDLDCIIDETGDVKGWFDCPDVFGHFPHGSSKQLFIHCDNGKPFVKKCADGTEFSPEYLVCVWVH